MPTLEIMLQISVVLIIILLFMGKRKIIAIEIIKKIIITTHEEKNNDENYLFDDKHDCSLTNDNCDSYDKNDDCHYKWRYYIV